MLYVKGEGRSFESLERGFHYIPFFDIGAKSYKFKFIEFYCRFLLALLFAKETYLVLNRSE